jgi:sulfite reductase subunit A
LGEGRDRAEGGNVGYVLSADGFDQVIRELGETYRLWAPVLKRGEGRFTDTDVVRYDFVDSADQIELGQRSDYSFKELLTPLSQTLFYYTEDEVTVPKEDARDVIAFVRACDLNALRRLDQMYLHNGARTDWHYDRIRDRVRFALIGCTHEFEDCFCASMGSNVAPEGSYDFSLEVGPEGNLLCDVPAEGLRPAFSRAALAEKDVVPAHVDANETQVRVPAEVPNEVYSAPMWDDYTERCIECGRCNFSARPAPATPCRKSSTPTTAAWARGAAWRRAAWWTATPTSPAAGSTAARPASACASRCCTRCTTSGAASATTCAWAAAAARPYAPSTSTSPSP